MRVCHYQKRNCRQNNTSCYYSDGNFFSDNENFPKDQKLNPIVIVTPTPDIDSGYTFARYDYPVDEFLKRYELGFAGGDLVITFSQEPKLMVQHTFNIELLFTNGKVLSAKTDEIAF